MSCYKEGNYFLEGMLKKQERIYPDSADFGIRVNDANAPHCKSVADALKEPIYFGGLKQHRKEIKSSLITDVTITIYIPWEEVEHTDNQYSCTKWEIGYTSTAPRGNRRATRYLTFDATRVIANKKDIWGR